MSKSLPKKSFGDPVICISPDDVIKYLEVMSKNTTIRYVPSELVNLITDDYENILRAIEIAPCIYFNLKKEIRFNSKIMKTTINSLRRLVYEDELRCK